MTVYVGSNGGPVSRQRAEQMRHPERWKARQAVFYRVMTGQIPRARDLTCVDCGKPAAQYDHHLGYSTEHQLDVQPVCRKCHWIREELRRPTCRRGHPYDADNSYIDPRGGRDCRVCAEGRSKQYKSRIGWHRESTRSTSVVITETADAQIAFLLEHGYARNKSELLRKAIAEAALRNGAA